MQLSGVIAACPDLAEVEVTTWIERGWVRPEMGATGWVFHEIDIARVRLIRDLRRDMGLAEDALPVVLSLLDQVYALRSELQAVAEALRAQPDEVRAEVARSLRREPD